MTEKPRRKQLTGSGGTGPSKPGTAEMAEQVSAVSSSYDCEKTACQVDPRPGTTGKNDTKTRHDMDSTTKGIKVTDTGEVGSPRPGAVGMQRVPTVSLSDNRRGEQVGEQACTSSYATGPTGIEKERMVTEPLISELSSGDESIPPRRRAIANKRRKREILSTTSSASEATMCSNNEKGGRRNNKPQAPPSARTTKRLPTEEERLAELRHAPTANLAVNILKIADSIEQMAATASNLKGTYVRHQGTMLARHGLV